MIVVMLMVMVVNILLLFASGRFLGRNASPLRVLAASCFGAFFAMLSLLPDFSFLDHMQWRLWGLLLTGLTAYGLTRSAVPRTLLFVLLHLSLGGITGRDDRWQSVLLGAAGIGFACLVVSLRQNLVPIELTFAGKTVRLTALRDTGHALQDPVTGKPVLVVDAEAARKLTGLSQKALQDPVNHLGILPGLRLIPYKTVGNTGFLLALQIREAKIGNRQETMMVALSPNLLGKRYQALTGGNL